MGTLTTEIHILASRIGTSRSVLLHLALLAAFGIWIPQMKGLDFLDTQILAAYMCLGLLFAAPATAQAFPEGIPPSFKEAASRIVAGVLYGEVVAALLAGSGIATVYLGHRGKYVPQPDWETLAKCALFGLAASLMLASLAGLVAARFSKGSALICLRLAFFGLLVVFYYWGRWLPDVGLAATAACFAVAGLFIGILARVCK
jgi:hypothetical protein